MLGPRRSSEAEARKDGCLLASFLEVVLGGSGMEFLRDFEVDFLFFSGVCVDKSIRNHQKWGGLLVISKLPALNGICVFFFKGS